MFSGIVTETGTIKKISKKSGSARLDVCSESVGTSLKIGDSVAVNGVCLSITEKNGSLSFDVVGNTLKKTNLKRLKAGDKVNLEGPLKFGDTISGHVVSGHVDAERRVRSNRQTRDGWVLELGLSPEDAKYLIPRGSVAVDGVSLTVGEVTSGTLRIFLIPHTIENTILKLKKNGDYVNLEFDVMARYSENIGVKSSITEDLLRKKGFIR